jgi:hypothetical protein
MSNSGRQSEKDEKKRESGDYLGCRGIFIFLK